MKIQETIAKVASEVGAVGKNQRNNYDGYQYRGIDDLYNAFGPVMAANNLVVSPMVIEHSLHERTTQKGGTANYAFVLVQYTFHNGEDSMIAVVPGEGLDRGDKAFNKAMAAAEKTVFFQTFMIPIEVNGASDSEEHSHEVGNPQPKKPETPPQPQKPETPPPQHNKAEAAMLANAKKKLDKAVSDLVITPDARDKTMLFLDSRYGDELVVEIGNMDTKLEAKYATVVKPETADDEIPFEEPAPEVTPEVTPEVATEVEAETDGQQDIF
jgi:hypothetical protein